MAGPGEATAAVRVAVRRSLADLGADAVVAAAVSGGADSLALAAALAFERPGSCALVVDHGLQERSAEVAAAAADACRAVGLTAHVLPAVPPLRPRESRGAERGGHDAAGGADDDLPLRPRESRGPERGGYDARASRAPGGGGPEGRARGMRYAALQRATADLGVAAVLLGHTLDDQAETVLLGLARGAGARSLAGMAPVRGRYRRPLLGVTRETTRRAGAEQGLEPWEDPHNEDPSYARVRARATALPVLEEQLGPGVAEALARSARLLREDADALDALAEAALGEGVTDEVDRLAPLLPAVRARVLKRWAEQACGRAVTAAHVDAIRALVEDWRGQGPVALPGGGAVAREEGRLAFRP